MEHDILFGVSLGGIAALEIAAACPCIKTVVLVSSAADTSEYSPLLRFFAKYVPAWAVPFHLLENDRIKSFLVTGSTDRKYALGSAGFFVPLGKRYYRMALEAVKKHDGTLYEKVTAAGCRVLRIHGSDDAAFPGCKPGGECPDGKERHASDDIYESARGVFRFERYFDSRGNGYSLSLESITIVTGPSLRRSTFISAPNMPAPTARPRSSLIFSGTFHTAERLFLL